MIGSIQLDDKDSSWVRGISYQEPGLLVLRLQAKTYAYIGVPTDVAAGLFKADSHGAYFNRYIKGQYDAIALPQGGLRGV